MNKNLLINGEFNIAQRGISFDSTTTPKNDDDNYLLDRWVLLSDGNDVVDVSQETDAPKGSVYAQKAVVQTANKKFGFIQIIENANCQQIVADVASLSLQAQTGAGAIRNIRAAILSWSGTVDAVTSDVVSAWNAEGTDPTLVTDWTYQNIPQNLSLSTSYQKYQIENIAINSDAKNVAVFIWVDDTDAAASDELFLGQVQLEKGSAVSDYEHRQIGDELALGKRYFQTMNSTPLSGYIAAVVTASLARVGFNFAVEMRVKPTFTQVGSAINLSVPGLNTPATGINVTSVSKLGGNVTFTFGATLTPGQAGTIGIDEATTSLQFDSEL